MPENGWKHNEEMLTENKTIYIYQSNIDVYKAMATDEYLFKVFLPENIRRQFMFIHGYSLALHWGVLLRRIY